MDRNLAEIGVTYAQAIALYKLHALGGSAPLGTLAKRLGQVKSNVTQMVDRLEKAKWVLRVNDPKDRRVILVELTSDGKTKLDTASGVLERFETQARELFSGDEYEQLFTLLNKLATLR